jgi:hypothetical protein
MKKIITSNFRHLSAGFSKCGWTFAQCHGEWYCFAAAFWAAQVQFGYRRGHYSFAWSFGKRWYGKMFKSIC